MPTLVFKILWTLASFIGVILSAWGIIDLRKDVKAAKVARNGKRVVAAINYRSAKIAFLTQFLFFYFGITSFFRDEPVTYDLRQVLFVSAIVLISIATVIGLALNRRDRIRLLSGKK